MIPLSLLLAIVAAAIGGTAGMAAAYPPAYPTTVAGTAWTELIAPSGSAPSLFNVSCPDAADCYAVGQGGTIKAGSATTAWSTVASGTSLDLSGIACPSTTTCFAAGGTTGSGVVVGTASGPSGWHVVLSAPQRLNGISCASTTTCVAVGESGLIERTVDGGASWTVRASGTLQTLDAVSCPTATVSCLAVGSLGTYETSGTSGGGWQLHSTGSIQELASVRCMSRSRCIVGTAASAWVVTGFTTWTQVGNNASYEPWCVSATTCIFASGEGATTTTNAGQTWVTNLSGSTDWFSGVSCPTTTSCVAVGDGGVIATSASAFAVHSPPAISVTTYQPPTPDSFVQAIAAGPDGAMWGTEFHGDAILRITTTGQQQEFPVPTPASEPEAIVPGPDGAMWFTESGVAHIGRITMAGTITEYVIPSYACSTCNISDIAVGPDGALWFTELQEDRIGRITTDGVITQFALPPSTMPEQIVAGPDGNLWFTGYEDTINRMTIAGVLTQFPIPELGGFGGLVGITVGKDNRLWFTATVASWVGRMTTSGRLLAQYVVHPGIEQITTITPGPDGALWFADAQVLDRLTTTGVLTEYPAPGESWVALGPGKRSLWFASFAESLTGQVTSASF